MWMKPQVKQWGKVWPSTFLVLLCLRNVMYRMLTSHSTIHRPKKKNTTTSPSFQSSTHGRSAHTWACYFPNFPSPYERRGRAMPQHRNRSHLSRHPRPHPRWSGPPDAEVTEESCDVSPWPKTYPENTIQNYENMKKLDRKKLEKSEIIWNYDPAALVIADTFTFRVAARLVKVTAGKVSPLKQRVLQTVAWTCTNCKQESAGSTNRTIDDLKYLIWAARVCPRGGLNCSVRVQTAVHASRGGSSSSSSGSSATTRSEGLATGRGGGGSSSSSLSSSATTRPEIGRSCNTIGGQFEFVFEFRWKSQVRGTAYFFSRGGRGAVRVRGRVRGRTAVRALLPERGGAVRVGVQVRMGGQFEFEFECALLLRLFFICIVYLASSYLYWYLISKLVPMYFFLGTHCGVRRCALVRPSPLHPPTRFYF